MLAALLLLVIALAAGYGLSTLLQNNQYLRSMLKLQTRRALQLSKDWDVILNAARDGFIWLDRDGCIQRTNPAARKLLHETEPRLVGAPIANWLPDLPLPSRDSDLLPQGNQTHTALNLGDQCDIPVRAWIFSTHDGVMIRLSEARGEWATMENAAPTPSSFLHSLHSRRSILRQLRHALIRASAADQRVAIVIADLDQFQRINDSFGHAIGDQMLEITAARLNEYAPQPHILGRLGSDEFVLLLLNAPPAAQCLQQIEHMQTQLATPTRLNGQDIVVTASIGLSLYPSSAQAAEQLLQLADIAVHAAKRQGRNQLVLQDGTHASLAHTELQTELALRTALDKGEIWLTYQPQVDLRDGRTIGCEALIRWQHPVLGQVAPASFIPVAESSGLIASLGSWVLRTACHDAQRMREIFGSGFVMSVNVSALQFQTGDLIDVVRSALFESGLPAHCLEVEITENLLLQNQSQTREILQTLRDMGVLVAIDDFGTGYSSLSYLLNYPIDKLKIDRSFIEHLSTSKHDATLTSAIIAMAHQIGLVVVAEGVEQSEQGQFLSRHDCDMAQGFLYGRAVRAEDFIQQSPLFPQAGLTPDQGTPRTSQTHPH